MSFTYSLSLSHPLSFFLAEVFPFFAELQTGSDNGVFSHKVKLFSATRSAPNVWERTYYRINPTSLLLETTEVASYYCSVSYKRTFWRFSYATRCSYDLCLFFNLVGKQQCYGIDNDHGGQLRRPFPRRQIPLRVSPPLLRVGEHCSPRQRLPRKRFCFFFVCVAEATTVRDVRRNELLRTAQPCRCGNLRQAARLASYYRPPDAVLQIPDAAVQTI